MVSCKQPVPVCEIANTIGFVYAANIQELYVRLDKRTSALNPLAENEILEEFLHVAMEGLIDAVCAVERVLPFMMSASFCSDAATSINWLSNHAGIKLKRLLYIKS